MAGTAPSTVAGLHRTGCSEHTPGTDAGVGNLKSDQGNAKQIQIIPDHLDHLVTSVKCPTLWTRLCVARNLIQGHSLQNTPNAKLHALFSTNVEWWWSHWGVSSLPVGAEHLIPRLGRMLWRSVGRWCGITRGWRGGSRRRLNTGNLHLSHALKITNPMGNDAYDIYICPLEI